MGLYIVPVLTDVAHAAFGMNEPDAIRTIFGDICGVVTSVSIDAPLAVRIAISLDCTSRTYAALIHIPGDIGREHIRRMAKRRLHRWMRPGVALRVSIHLVDHATNPATGWYVRTSMIVR